MREWWKEDELLGDLALELRHPSEKQVLWILFVMRDFHSNRIKNWRHLTK